MLYRVVWVYSNERINFINIYINHNEEKRIANGKIFVPAEVAPSIEKCSKD